MKRGYEKVKQHYKDGHVRCCGGTPKVCQHDLLLPNCTVDVSEDHRDGVKLISCDVCGRSRYQK